MTPVRLQCPACSKVVKISEEVASQYPVVRCAQCQGLVTVASSRLPDNVPARADKESRSEKSRRKRKNTSAVPVKLIVGVVVGLLVMAGVGTGVYFLITSMTAPTPEKFVKKTISVLERMVAAVEGMKTAGDVPGGIKKLVQCRDELVEYAKTMPKEPPTPEDAKLMSEYLPRMVELQNKLRSAFLNLTHNQEVARALAEENKKYPGGLQALLANTSSSYDGTSTSNRPDINPLNGMSIPHFPNMMPPTGTSGSTASNVKLSPEEIKQQDFEHLILTKRGQVQMIPDVLNNVRDASDGNHALFVVENMIKSLKENEAKLQPFTEQNFKAKSRFAIEAERDIEKAVREISVQVARIERLENIGTLPKNLTKQLESVGLYQPGTITADASVASNNTPPKEQPKEESNPFQPSAPAKGATPGSSAPAGENPFEPVKGGSMASKPATRPIVPSESNPAIDGILSKLTSSEFFRKQEGIREANAARVDEARRKEVLDALFTLFEDTELHTRVDLLKAYKKWAGSQEDRERLGQVAESLLKETWTKKDALRYFGEGKIITASKEVARLLRDQFDRKEAAESLIAMGSEAEKAVMPYVTDLEAQVRHMAIEVLARIGTRECLPELKKVQNDRQVGLAARQAIALINKRGQ